MTVPPSTGRLVGPAATRQDEVLDRAVRPLRLQDFVGQPAGREQLAIFI